jgi:hypothetical protein
MAEGFYSALGFRDLGRFIEYVNGAVSRRTSCGIGG